MKLIFFVVGCMLVIVRLYFSFAGHADNHDGHANVVIKSENFEERIGWQGNIRLSDSENAIMSMSPGAYIKYIRNDTSFTAKSNVKGEISYTFENPSNPDDSLRSLIMHTALSEMVHYGFNADARIEAIFRRGGYPALIRELDRAKLDNLQEKYLRRILRSDSLSAQDMIALFDRIRETHSDDEKERLLQKLPVGRVDSASVLHGYLDVIASMGGDDRKRGAIMRLIDAPDLSDTARTAIIKLFPRIDANDQRFDLYKKLMQKDSLSNAQWSLVLAQADSFGDENRRSELLIAVAGKMPRTDSLRADYLRAAKSLTSDEHYGRALRAINAH